MIIGGSVVFADEQFRVTNSFVGEHVGTISVGTARHAADAVSAAAAAQEQEFPAHRRYDLLMRVADMIDGDADTYALDLSNEGHKSIREARREPTRSASVLRLAAEEARRITGETLPFDIKPGSERRIGE
jgi:glyceraldehyde-3-phosphate dehydrogenase (NADP+)